MTCMSLSAVRANSREGAAENYDLPFKHTVCCPASSTRQSNRPRLWMHNRSGNAWDSKKKKEDRNIYAGFILFTIHISGQSGVVAAQQIDSFGALIPTVPRGQVVVVVGGWWWWWGWDAQPSGLQSSYFLSALKTDRLLWLFDSPSLSLNLFDSPPAITPSVLNNTLWQTANSKTFSQMY